MATIVQMTFTNAVIQGKCILIQIRLNHVPLGSNCQYISIDLSDGLDSKLLPEPMLTKLSDAIWQ